MTDGKSAQLTNQFSPSATVRDSPHPLESLVAVRNAYLLSPVFSTQLRMMRPSCVAFSSGSRLSPFVGDSLARISSAGSVAAAEFLGKEELVELRLQPNTSRPSSSNEQFRTRHQAFMAKRNIMRAHGIRNEKMLAQSCFDDKTKRAQKARFIYFPSSVVRTSGSQRLGLPTRLRITPAPDIKPVPGRSSVAGTGTA